MNRYCSRCGDEYDPVEYRTPPADPGDPEFCSDECENGCGAVDHLDPYACGNCADCHESYDEAYEEAYDEARYGAASVWP